MPWPDEGVLARVLQPHRAAGALREQSEVDLDGEILLAPETAADQGAADADLVVGHPDRVGDGPEVLDDLGGDADVDHLVLVHPRKSHLRLQKGVLLEGRAVSVLDDQVGLGEPCLDIALPDPAFRDDVVGRGDDGRAGLHRLQRIVDAGNRLEPGLHQLHGMVCDVAGLRRDERHGLAEVADPLPDEDLLAGVQAFLADLSGDVGRRDAVREIRGGEHARDALELSRPGDVQPHQAGAGDVGANHPHVQHVGHHVIAGVGRPARHLSGRVGTGQRVSDLAEADVGAWPRFARDTAHGASLPARMAAAASPTASKTFV